MQGRMWLGAVQGGGAMAYCSNCGGPLTGQPPGCKQCGLVLAQVRVAGPGLGSFIRVSGRAQRAGMLTGLGGFVVILSAFMDWRSLKDGYVAITTDGLKLAGGGVFDVVTTGLVFLYLSTRILTGKAGRRTRIAQWVALAAAIAGFVAVTNTLTPSDHPEVQAGVGFLVALLGLVLALIGTILLQMARRAAPQPAQAVQPAPAIAVAATPLSDDGAFWWDGSAWRSLADSLPAGAQRSPDGRHWWDGTVWRDLPPAASTPGVPTAT